MPVSSPPPRWRNQNLVLYHGTTLLAARRIEAEGVSVERFSRLNLDFGAGFYATTIEPQAQESAMIAAKRRMLSDPLPAIVEIVVSRDAIAALDVLAFVDSREKAEDFWSLVYHCRQGGGGHFRASKMQDRDPRKGFYDVVFGPVAARWELRVAKSNADQVSFHTQKAELLLNSIAARRMIEL